MNYDFYRDFGCGANWLQTGPPTKKWGGFEEETGMQYIKVSILAGLFLFSHLSITFAAWGNKPEFRLEELYRFDIREDNHSLYTNRVSAAFIYLDKRDKALFKLMPFFEARRNIEKHLWERKEFGAEIGTDLLPWFYFGQAIQRALICEDYEIRQIYETRKNVESETKFLLSHNLISGKYIKLKGFILDEYTYDFNEGRGARNELAAGLIMPLNKHLETQVNWRHIDRIHFYDSDVLEGAVILIF